MAMPLATKKIAIKISWDPFLELQNHFSLISSLSYRLKWGLTFMKNQHPHVEVTFSMKGVIFKLCWKEQGNIDIGNRITSKFCDLQHLKSSCLWVMLWLSCSWKNCLQSLSGPRTLERWGNSCSPPHQGSDFFCSVKGSRSLIYGWKETFIKLNANNSQQVKLWARQAWFKILVFQLTSLMKPEKLSPSL